VSVNPEDYTNGNMSFIFGLATNSRSKSKVSSAERPSISAKYYTVISI
jgi:hypothetical protein